jgi:uncharacterized protein YndB with AHSA1/START domain
MSQASGAGFWKRKFDQLEDLLKRMDHMTEAKTETRSVIVERTMPHPPEKVWRALTQPHLIQEWLMKNDFAPSVGHRFTLRSDPVPQWDGKIDCEVLTVEPNKTLAYTWGALGLGSVVTFTLTKVEGGTHLRMEQEGFKLPQQKQAYAGATYGWQRFIGNLEQVLARTE